MFIAALSLSIVGCAVPANVQKLQPSADIFVEPTTPLTVTAQDLETVSFSKVLYRIDTAKPVGRIMMDGRKIEDVPYKGDAIREGNVDLNMIGLEELRGAGYSVLGGENLLFAQDESAKARYVIGGTVKSLYFVLHGSFWTGIQPSSPLEGGMEVEWQVFDTAARKVRFSQSTRGYGKSNGSIKAVEQIAFRNAFRALLAKPELSANLKKSTGVVQAESGISAAKLTLTPAVVGTFQLPADAAKVYQGIVTLKSGLSHGTGMVISSEGHILTAAHVVSGLKTVQVQLHGGLTLEAQVERIDESKDLALVKLPGKGYTPLRLAETRPAVGSEVYAVGTPLTEELAYSLTRGVVSAFRSEQGREFLQTDTAVSPGNSGGPLLNAQGEVVGVVSTKVVFPGAEGIAFAVPSDQVRSSLNLEWAVEAQKP